MMHNISEASSAYSVCTGLGLEPWPSILMTLDLVSCSCPAEPINVWLSFRAGSNPIKKFAELMQKLWGRCFPCFGLPLDCSVPHFLLKLTHQMPSLKCCHLPGIGKPFSVVAPTLWNIISPWVLSDLHTFNLHKSYEELVFHPSVAIEWS